MVSQYCTDYDTHVTRLIAASGTVDQNHQNLIWAIDAVGKLRDFAGFNIR